MAILAEQVADDGVGVAGQVLKVLCSFATNDLGLLRQDDAELAQQTSMRLRVAVRAATKP